jgi:hypothetical protein
MHPRREGAEAAERLRANLPCRVKVMVEEIETQFWSQCLESPAADFQTLRRVQGERKCRYF